MLYSWARVENNLDLSAVYNYVTHGYNWTQIKKKIVSPNWTALAGLFLVMSSYMVQLQY